MERKQSFGSQPQGNMEGYHGSGAPCDLSQGTMGTGMAKGEMGKSPKYVTAYDVKSVTRGHHDVGSKI